MGISSNHEQFMNDWLREVREIRERKLFFIVQVTFDALGALIRGSAVDTGTYRASHDLTIGAPSQKKLKRPRNAGPSERQGEASRRESEAERRLSTLTPEVLEGGLSIFITNNLEYAEVLEQGDSERPGRGLYQIARKRAEDNWNTLVQRGLV